jgi:hypothetical protein
MKKNWMITFISEELSKPEKIRAEILRREDKS